MVVDAYYDIVRVDLAPPLGPIDPRRTADDGAVIESRAGLEWHGHEFRRIASLIRNDVVHRKRSEDVRDVLARRILPYGCMPPIGKRVMSAGSNNERTRARRHHKKE